MKELLADSFAACLGRKPTYYRYKCGRRHLVNAYLLYNNELEGFHLAKHGLEYAPERSLWVPIRPRTQRKETSTMPKITKRTVGALVPAEREKVVWDDDIKGFGVRVHPSGRKVYIVKYRHEGRAIKTTIGSHGPITPAAARARAAEIVTLARTGRDLEGKMPRKSGGPTMADLAGRFMDYAPDPLKPSTARLSREIIGKRILPRLGKHRGVDIGRADAALHREMRAVPGPANRTLGVLSRLLTMAEIWEMRPEGVSSRRFARKYPERKRERCLSDAEDRRLGAMLRDAEREGLASPAAIAAIRLLMLTGCRSDELLSLRWDHVELARGELRLPDAKTGAQIVHPWRTRHCVLRGIRRIDDGPWVFPARSRAPSSPSCMAHGIAS